MRFEHLPGLTNGVLEADDLIEGTERQEQEHQAQPYESCCEECCIHQQPLMMSATRRALAMMVSVGLTAPIEGKKLASVM